MSVVSPRPRDPPHNMLSEVHAVTVHLVGGPQVHTINIHRPEAMQDIRHKCNPEPSVTGGVTQSYEVDLPDSFVAANAGALRNNAWIEIRGASIDAPNGRIVQPPGAHISVTEPPRGKPSTRRQLSVTGAKKILVIRVNADDGATAATTQDLFTEILDPNNPVRPGPRSVYVQLRCAVCFVRRLTESVLATLAPLLPRAHR